MLDLVIEARKASIGPGMDVRRILPFRLRRMVGPFIFMDHAGAVSLRPQVGTSMDVLPIKGFDPILIAKEPTTLMLLGGEPLGERFIWWNFVSSRKDRIEQAKADWKAGRIQLPPTDNHEFIPLPEDRSRQAGSPPPQALS